LGILFGLLWDFSKGVLRYFLGFIAGKTTEVIPNRGVALIGDVLGIGSAGLMQRKVFALYLVYVCLVLCSNNRRWKV
jgi:hypothetical protein